MMYSNLKINLYSNSPNNQVLGRGPGKPILGDRRIRLVCILFWCFIRSKQCHYLVPDLLRPVRVKKYQGGEQRQPGEYTDTEDEVIECMEACIHQEDIN